MLKNSLTAFATAACAAGLNVPSEPKVPLKLAITIKVWLVAFDAVDVVDVVGVVDVVDVAVLVVVTKYR